MSATMRWCIACEKMVAVEEPIEGHSVVEFVPDEGTQEIFWCEGAFVECEPPTNDPDFDLRDEPSGDELLIMNKNAEDLLADLEG